MCIDASAEEEDEDDPRVREMHRLKEIMHHSVAAICEQQRKCECIVFRIVSNVGDAKQLCDLGSKTFVWLEFVDDNCVVVRKLSKVRLVLTYGKGFYVSVHFLSARCVPAMIHVMNLRYTCHLSER